MRPNTLLTQLNSSRLISHLRTFSHVTIVNEGLDLLALLYEHSLNSELSSVLCFFLITGRVDIFRSIKGHDYDPLNTCHTVITFVKQTPQ